MPEVIYESSTTLVTRVNDGTRTLICKALKSPSHSANAIVRYQHEFNVNQSLTSPYVCRAVEYDADARELFFEDVGGTSLRDFVRNRVLELDETLELATAIAHAVQSIHDEGVIHRDLNPANILVTEDRDIYLIDFGLATFATREQPDLDPRSHLAGTLQYISPEQTGRVNRAVDSRTDLYSLGVTLYELLAGRPPFTNSDPLELIHAHIAKTAEPLDQVTDRTPSWLAQVVQKLMSKQPEARYQTASSVADDLQRGAENSLSQSFALGRTDSPGQLVMPNRLYGRKTEIAELRALLERALAGETLFAKLVAPDGIGKSALVDEFARICARDHVLCATVHVPALPGVDYQNADVDRIWLELLRPVVRQALALDTAAGERVVSRLGAMKPEQVTALLPTIPELEHVAPSGDEIPAQITRAIDGLLMALSLHPVCLILEDADPLSEATLSALLTQAVQSKSLFMMFTSERDLAAPFASPRIATKTRTLELEPLDKAAIRILLSDMLSQNEVRVRDLARVIHGKTDGVPYDVINLIFELHHDGSIHFEQTSRVWAWDSQQVQDHYYSNNSVDRIRQQVENLVAEERHALAAAACYGNQFSVSEIAPILEKTDAEASVLLKGSVREGLLVEEQSRFRFGHPRVRSFVYSGVNESRKGDIHFRIADEMVRSQRAQGLEIWRIADHMNAAVDFAEPNDRHNEVAHYNLLAAREALHQGSFQPAYKYCRSGLALYSGTRAHHDPIYMELCQCAAEAAFLCGDFDQLQRVVEASSAGPNGMDEVRIRAAIVSNDLTAARELAIDALQALGEQPAPATSWPMATFHDRGFWRPHRSQFSSAVPRLNDARQQQIYRLYCHLLHIDYHLSNTGLQSFCDTVIEQADRHEGYSGEVAYAYAFRATLHAAEGRYNAAIRDSMDARVLAQKFPKDTFAVRAVTLLNGLVDPWTNALDHTLGSLDRNIARSLAHQDYEYAALATAFYATNALLRGLELGSLRRDLGGYVRQIAAYNNVTDTNIAQFVLQIISSLTGQTDRDDDQDSHSLLNLRNPDDRLATAFVYNARLFFALLFHDVAGASELLPTVKEYDASVRNSPFALTTVFAEGLIAISGNRRDVATAKRALKKLRRWWRRGAEHAEPKMLLLAAELAWLKKRITRSLELFETAAERARQLGLANDEGIAYERAARKCQIANRNDFAKLFAHNAHQAFVRWGATAKVTQIERDFQYLLEEDTAPYQNASVLSVGDLVDLTVRDFHSHTTTLESTEYSDRFLDTTTVLRAAQTISGEVMLDRVMTKLLRLTLEHAGAQKACILLTNEDGRLGVEAVATVDGDDAERLQPPQPVEESEHVPESIVQFVARTKEVLVLSDATKEDVFTQDTYVKNFEPLSVLCLPIINRGDVTGVMYVEHRWLTGVFTEQRVEVLALLASQAAISIENARLYADLHSARDEYRTLYDNAIEGLFRISGEGNLISANPTLAEILGFDEVDALLDEYRDLVDAVFVHKEDAQTFITRLEELHFVNALEAQASSRDGRTFWMSITARLNRDPELGDMIDGSLVDISEKIEREQADKQRQIAEAATEAKSEFLANMSHEIRTPMNAIVGFTQLALETQLDHKQHEYVASIRRAAENLLGIVSDVLDFSKIEAGKLTLEEAPFRLADSLADVQRLFRTELRKRGLAFSIDDLTEEVSDLPQPLILVGDALRLQQIFVNLVGNAAKFTDTGSIRLSVEFVARTNDEVTLEFAVEDTGIGISDEQRSRLFDSFEQAETSTTRRYGGTGLGLTICKRLVEVMGGEISVTSQPGRGSRFYFTARFGIGAADAVPLPDASRRYRNDDTVLEGRPLLVAEDNPINQQLALEFLERNGASVDIAHNGREAVARATEKDYDAVLMDIHMPEMDGLEAVRVIRSHGLTVPIVAVSADAMSQRRQSALDAGCDGYVTKPIDFEQLLAVLGPLLPPRELDPRQRRATDSAAPTRANANLDELSSQRLPGINLPDAIRGHNGNVKLMVKLMGDFGTYYGDAAQKIRAFVTEESFEEAERLAHNLHGVAGSFGAQRLKEASKTLELALARGDAKNLLGLVQSFELALTEVLESTAAIASNEVVLRADDTSAELSH